jgi:pyroglutamyl-peptidase
MNLNRLGKLMKTLLTGFVPFGDVAVNPSQLIVQQIAQRREFPELLTAVLPVEFAVAGDCIRQLIRDLLPEAVLCLGVAQNRDAINLERVALNLDDARIPDNAGQRIFGEPIVSDGPVGYWSTLPLEPMEKALRELEIPVIMSNHAGAYLCNHVFFSARHELECQQRKVPCGFVHVPRLCETASEDCAGLSLDTMVKAIECCLHCIQGQ